MEKNMPMVPPEEEWPDKPVTEMWVWVAVHPNGGEGVPAAHVGGAILPLVAADVERVESLRPMALDCARNTGMDVKLLRFHSVECVETIYGTM